MCVKNSRFYRLLNDERDTQCSFIEVLTLLHYYTYNVIYEFAVTFLLRQYM